MMASRDRVNENDADDSDTDSLSDVQRRCRKTPKRSATVSPAAKHRFRHTRNFRRRSDVYQSSTDCRVHANRGRLSVEKLTLYDNSSLRKTNSEPSVEQQQQALTLDAIRQLIDTCSTIPKCYDCVRSQGSLIRVNPQIDTPAGRTCIASAATDHGLLEVWATPRQSIASDSEEEIINTDIEELRDAVESIQSLQRVLKHPTQHPSNVVKDPDLPVHAHLMPSSDSTGALKGITTNLGGNPRGVMQFLPSAQTSQFEPTLDSYSWKKQQSNGLIQTLRRKASVPDEYLKFVSTTERSSPHPRPTRRITRSSDTEQDFFGASGSLNSKGVDSLAGVNRFSKLLNSFRSVRQDSSRWPYQANLLVPPEANVTQRQIQQSLMQADQLLWKRRSRASLRRHQDIRNMAVRELYETERTFVDSLEYLVQKYMRPLKQPLECTLIDGELVDKIFYKIPEILAHHQVLFAALSARMEFLQSDTVIGDVLLAHFTKQSMIETFMAFVDNFKHAKQAIWEARQRPAFEKYYLRCSREHRAKLDLDSLLILPIQRVPRYELILKQVVKHTSVEHSDYDKLILVQQHIHQLAVTINCQREEKEKMEQRLREIEAIVDGLDDLVYPGRTFNRYDVVIIQDRRGEKKQRCIFMMSDQLIVTSICRKVPGRDSGSKSQQFTQSTDFLDNNRFKLLIKISLYDVEPDSNTIPLLQNVERELRNAQEDVNILSKILDLVKLIKTDHDELLALLNQLYTQRLEKLKFLQEQMTSNPELKTVHLQITTFDGIETLTIQFTNAEKRTLWENAFLETKNLLKNNTHIEQTPPLLKTILMHRNRHGLTCNAAAPTLLKASEGTSNVWMCLSDKFSGQVVVLNANGEPQVETTYNMGNSSINAICAVPIPRKKTSSIKSYKKNTDIIEMELDSSSSEFENSDSEQLSSAQSTMWIGNEDGDIFILNPFDNIRVKTREKIIRHDMAIVDIAYVEDRVFVSKATKMESKLLCYERSKETFWEFEKPKNVMVPIAGKIGCMIVVTNRLCFSAQNTVYLLNPHELKIENSAEVSATPTETISHMASFGSNLFIVIKESTTVKLLNTFTLECLSEFNIAPIVNKTLATKEDIIRNHKLGSLRITALLSVRNQLWIGTSAGILLTTPVCRIKGVWASNFHVCSIGHIGPCRFLTAVNVTSLNPAIHLNKRRISLNVPTLQQQDQIYIISGGNGVENFTLNNDDEETGVDDANNHLIFWQI